MSYSDEEFTCDTIDGCPFAEQVIKKYSGPCEACGFDEYAPGDVKYVIEHWENKRCKHDSSSREHICPSCLIQKGAPKEYYHQNQNAPKLDDVAREKFFNQAASQKKLETMQKALSNVECDSCNKKGSDTNTQEKNVEENQMHAIGFIALTDKNENLQFLCLDCTIQKGFLSFLPQEVQEENSKKRARA